MLCQRAGHYTKIPRKKKRNDLSIYKLYKNTQFKFVIHTQNTKQSPVRHVICTKLSSQDVDFTGRPPPPQATPRHPTPPHVAADGLILPRDAGGQRSWNNGDL